MVNIIVCALIAAFSVMVIHHLIKEKKAGKSSCGCGCSCSGCSGCGVSESRTRGEEGER